MHSFSEEFPGESSAWIGLSRLVDVFEQHALFEVINDYQVVALSRLNGQRGFDNVGSVRKSTGISVRRILREGLTAADLGAALCDRLERAGRCRMVDFDAILLCHSHVDPGRCRQLAEELGERLQLPETAIEAFNFGCCGFLRLLQLGIERLTELRMSVPELANGSLRRMRIALLSVETPEMWHDGSDRLFCGLVSAGATAAVLEYGHGLPVNTVNVDDVLIPAHRRPNPDPMFYRETTDVFTFRGRPCRRMVMRMNPEPVFLNGIELMLDSLRDALRSIDRRPGERVVVAPHQPSGKLLRALVATARSEFPGVVFLDNLDQYGNTISSSVSTILSRLPEVLAANHQPPLRQGDHLILLAAGICMERMGDFMTAGHACLKWTESDAARTLASVSDQPAVSNAAEFSTRENV